jgi:hypothetical protein
MRISLAHLASFFLLLSVLFALFVGGAALNGLGLSYTVDDSAAGLKIHPYVVLVLIAALIVATPLRSGRSRLSDRRFRTPVFCSALLGAVLIGRALSTSHQALGFVVDTLLSALWAAAVVPFMSERAARRIWKLGIAFVTVESVMATLEVITKMNFIPVDTWYGSYFRATALHGHPLNNALVLVTIAFALQVSGSQRTSILIFVLTTAALSAFGARGALMSYLAFNLLLVTRFALTSARRMAIVGFGLPIMLAALTWIVLSGTLGDRITNVGAYGDDSSETRLHAVEILQTLNWAHLLVGTDADQVARLMDQAEIGVIENFVVTYILMFGLVCTALLFACIWICYRRMVTAWSKATRRRIHAVFAVFFLTALTNNSLVTKTPALYLCFMFCWAAGRALDRREHSTRHPHEGVAHLPRPV